MTFDYKAINRDLARRAALSRIDLDEFEKALEGLDETQDEVNRAKQEFNIAKLKSESADSKLKIKLNDIKERFLFDFYTTFEAAKVLNISVPSVNHRLQRGQYPAFQLLGKWYIRRDKVDEEAGTSRYRSRIVR